MFYYFLSCRQSNSALTRFGVDNILLAADLLVVVRCFCGMGKWVSFSGMGLLYPDACFPELHTPHTCSPNRYGLPHAGCP